MNHPTTPPAAVTKQPHICIVDDNQMAREVIADLLSTEGYEVSLASSGPEIIEHIGNIQPDVILMDVMMPGMSGYDVCRALKQEEQWQHIPIILVTALNGREDMLQGLNAGADEFLSKPVNGSELRARVRTMLRIKHQYDALQSVLQLREDLSHMLIHDMRTPLTVAMLYNDFILRRVPDGSKDKEYATIVRTSLRALDSFMDEVLTVARMEQGALRLERTEADIKTLAAEVVETNREAALLRQFHLRLDVPDKEMKVCLDVSLFRRVIDNLLSNAFKFAPENSTVTVRLQYEATAVNYPHRPSFCLQVLDEGPGIAPEDQERIFNKYEIVTLKKKNGRQTGLGLAFCKMVVEAHGGRIFASANTPQGAVLTVEL